MRHVPPPAPLDKHYRHFAQVLSSSTPIAPHSAKLAQAVSYVLSNGGKRIRPLLVYSVGAVFGAPQNALDKIACAIEYLHAYSLVHDDLPAMDDDDLRRGQPTCHKAFDEATAILVGDGLQALATEVLCGLTALGIAAGKTIEIIRLFAAAAGLSGMVAGQMMDLEVDGETARVDYLEQLHQLKTGALLQACVEMTLQLDDDLAPQTKEALIRYVQKLGLAYQVQDDILDVEGDTAIMGKTQGTDAKHGKPTFPTLLGLSEAKALMHRLYEEAKMALSDVPQATCLYVLTDYIIQRDH